MDNFDSSLEQYEQTLTEIDKITRYGISAYHGDRPSLETIQDINNRFDQVVTLESVDVARIREAAGVIKRGSLAAFGSVKKMLESIKVAFDHTNQAGLVRARKMLASAEGDMYQQQIIQDKSLASKLHVEGDVPADLKRVTAQLLTDSKMLRSMIVPTMDRDIQKAANLSIGVTPRTEEEFHRWIMKIIDHVATSKSLIDFLDDKALASQYPGGYSLAVRTNQQPVIAENRKIKDAPSLAVMRKLEKIVARGWTTARNPLVYRAPVRSTTVRLLPRARVEEILNLADSLIQEGHAVTEMSKIFRGYSATAVSGNIGLVVDAMDGHIYVHEGEDGEKTYSTDKIDIDSDDRIRAEWCSSYFGAGVMQHHVMLPAIAAILYRVANGYIKLAEVSIKHFK